MFLYSFHYVIWPRSRDVNFGADWISLLSESISIVLNKHVLHFLLFVLLIVQSISTHFLLLSDNWSNNVFESFKVILRSWWLFHTDSSSRLVLIFYLLLDDIKPWTRNLTFVVFVPDFLSRLVFEYGWWSLSPVLRVFFHFFIITPLSTVLTS